ncbi:SusC/RagA family TonB-linked outer membrane protein [Zunongwangia sp.]|uniref:SusC/RagA family TonB-linked outer membrane protein n=1 Tax=Zunongwangia sp. TaxID=1965325 RepID=UPI003AA87CF2
MNRKKLLHSISILLFMLGFSMTAQQRKITGKIEATDGLPVASANVTVKSNPSIGTYTDFDGNFTLTVPVGETLVVSAVGMITKEISISSSKTNYVITLENDVSQLDEVVFTGFETVEQRLFTGANSTIDAEELNVEGMLDVSRMLEGKAAGINVQNVSGTFGAAPKITIRGASSIFGDTKPLFVIDGVVQEDIINLSFDELTSGDATTLIGSSIAGLNANDIQNIEILKDASATALYGARALNGVVVITTKSGRKETPATINYSVNLSVRTKPQYSQYDILDSQETMSILKELEAKGFLNPADVVQSSEGGVYYRMYDRINTFDAETGNFLLENTPEARNQFLQQYEMANTDWFDVLFKQSLTQNHSLSFTGGGKSNAYYASISFFNDPGLTVADDVKRLTASFKNTFYLNDKLNITLSSKVSNREQEAPGTYSQNTDVVRGEVSRDFDINPFSYALTTNRTVRPYDENGNLEYTWKNYADFNILNELNNNYIDLNVLDYLFQVGANYDFAKNLSYNLTASGRYVKSTNEHNVTENANAANAYRSMETTIIRDNNPFLYSDPEDPTAAPISVLPYGGIYTRRENYLENYYLRNTVTYNNKFDNIHDLYVLVGQDLRFVDREETFFEGYGIQYDKGYVPNTDPNFFDKYIGEGGKYFGKTIEKERTVSFFAKATYAFDNKYVFSATGRYDGSNRQGISTSSRWLPTWSVSGKWNITNEKFMNNVDFISNLQFRPSYGLTATSGPATNSLGIFTSDIIFRRLVSQRENVLNIEDLQNKDLTWEKQYETNLGLDIGLFNNRIQISSDYYIRKGFDLIDFVKTSGIGGQFLKQINNADMTTEGFEISINTKNIQTEDFSWTSTLNFSTFSQEITKLEAVPQVIDIVDVTGGNVLGYPRNSLFSYNFQGLDDRGLPTFILPEGENPVTGAYFQDNVDITDYLVYEGNVEPNNAAGFSNTFNYKNWRLNFFVSASWGNKVRLNPSYSDEYSDSDVFTKEYKNRWLLPGDENVTNIPVISDSRFSQISNLDIAYNAYNYSTARVADGGFVRMKNVSLAYTFDKALAKSIGLSNMSLKLLATNPFLIYSDDKLNGQDPEFFISGGVSYPIMKQYTLSFNLSL